MRCVNNLYKIIFFFLLASFSNYLFSNNQIVNSEEAAGTLDLIKTKIKLINSNIKKDGAKADSYQEELRQVEIELSKHQSDLDKTNKEINYLNKTTADLNKQHQNLTQKAAQQKKLLKIYLRKGYSINNQNKLKQFLAILDSNNILKNIRFYSVISQKQNDAIKEINLTISKINDVNDKLKNTLDDLKTKQARIQDIYKQINIERNKRQLVLNEIKNRIKSEYNVLNKYQEEKQELDNLIKLSNNDKNDLDKEINENYIFEELKEKLSLPVYNKLSVQKSLNGILINAKRGTLVHSISSGQVIFANWIKNFGLVLIIKHSNDYISVYGHNQTILKEKGEWVKRDEVIATVGDSGGLESPGLYFEVRDKEKPLNVQTWLR